MFSTRWMRIGGFASAAALVAVAAVYLIMRSDGNGPAEAGGGPGADLAVYAVGPVAHFTPQAALALAPDAAFLDRDGVERTLAEWRGRVVLVNLWATWCVPCREEMAALDRLQAALGGPDFGVVAISIDRGDGARPQAFLDEIGVKDLAFYHDPTGRLSVRFGAFGLPTSLLVSREGEILGRLVGPAEWDAPEAQALIRAAAGIRATVGGRPNAGAQVVG